MKEKERGKQSLKVVIVGNGKVGFSLAEQLVKEKYDVTIVDMREESLRRASDALDIMSVKGNGVSVATLEDAGAAEADLLVAATNSDEVKYGVLPHGQTPGGPIYHCPHPQPGVQHGTQGSEKGYGH